MASTLQCSGATEALVADVVKAQSASSVLHKKENVDLQDGLPDPIHIYIYNMYIYICIYIYTHIYIYISHISYIT